MEQSTTRSIPLSVLTRMKFTQEVYLKYSGLGVPNRTIWRRYVHPVLGISERTFYNYISAKLADKEIKTRFPKTRVVQLQLALDI